MSGTAVPESGDGWAFLVNRNNYTGTVTLDGVAIKNETGSIPFVAQKTNEGVSASIDATGCAWYDAEGNLLSDAAAIAGSLRSSGETVTIDFSNFLTGEGTASTDTGSVTFDENGKLSVYTVDGVSYTMINEPISKRLAFSCK